MRFALAAALALAAAVPADAAVRQVALPHPGVPVTLTPPVGEIPQQALQSLLPGIVNNDLEVRAGVRLDGAVASVEVLQHLRVTGVGDYVLFVPAPVTDVLPVAGTQGQPGFQRGAVIWRGFSPGSRTLAALVRLGPVAAGRSLPLEVSLRATVGGRELIRGRRSGELELTVEVRNRTETAVRTIAGRGKPRELGRALDLARRAIASGAPIPPILVQVADAGSATVRVDAPFRVTGEVVFAGGTIDGRPARVPVAGRVGGTAPATLRVRLRGAAHDLGAPRLRLRAVPLLDVSGLRPPDGGSWSRARPRNGRRMFSLAVGTMLRLARAGQYREFLRNPDPSAGLERSTATYVYTTMPASAQRATGSGDDGSAVPGALLVAGALLGLAALAVTWAHL
ncbi:MAG: hypothetical protein ABR583_12780 [Gaiellaceae bacterium]